jgi:hypothetical protein
MAALVQTLPAQTSTVTMLGRPSSSGGYSPSGSHGQLRNHPQPTRYNMSSTGYRGMPASGPVAPYAFTSTPQLPNLNSRPFALNSGRSISSPKAPHPTASPSSQPLSSTTLPQIDAGNRLSLGLPAIPTGSLMGSPQLSPSLPTAPASKPSPDRYRRTVRRSEGEAGMQRVTGGSALPSGSGMAAVGSLYNHPTQSSSTPSLGSQQSHRLSMHSSSSQSTKPSLDDLQLARPQHADLAARYRRRSFGSIETAGLNHASDSQDTASPHPNTFVSSAQVAATPQLAMEPPRPIHHRHTSSSDSVSSARSGRSSRPGSVSPIVHSLLDSSNICAGTVTCERTILYPRLFPETRTQASGSCSHRRDRRASTVPSIQAYERRQ